MLKLFNLKVFVLLFLITINFKIYLTKPFNKLISNIRLPLTDYSIYNKLNKSNNRSIKKTQILPVIYPILLTPNSMQYLPIISSSTSNQDSPIISNLFKLITNDNQLSKQNENRFGNVQFKNHTNKLFNPIYNHNRYHFNENQFNLRNDYEFPSFDYDTFYNKLALNKELNFLDQFFKNDELINNQNNNLSYIKNESPYKLNYLNGNKIPSKFYNNLNSDEIPFKNEFKLDRSNSFKNEFINESINEIRYPIFYSPSFIDNQKNYHHYYPQDNQNTYHQQDLNQYFNHQPKVYSTYLFPVFSPV